MRWTAASVVVALATAVLALCGGGTALAATAGSSVTSVTGITGANVEPLVAVASGCLLAGTAALVAGRTRRVPSPAGKRRRHRRSAR